MADRKSSPISSRRKPKQARSNDLVAAILEAALQVLEKEGAQRFTTTRVAERAGVSVGSVYQYFPNKASILFRLQSDEWKQTSEMLGGILEDTQRPPLERLRMLVHAFVRSECEEAGMRVALMHASFENDIVAGIALDELGYSRALGVAVPQADRARLAAVCHPFGAS